MITLDDLRRALRPLSLKISNLIGLGTIKRVDDSKNTQELQVELLEGETRDEVERLQQYGLTSNPPEGSDCLVVFVGGRRDQAYCLAAEKRGHRLVELESGEVALYDAAGTKIVLKASGDIEITPASGKLKLEGDFDVTGNIEVSGQITAAEDVTGGGVSLKTHTHGATLTVSGVNSPTTNNVTGTATGSTDLPN
jgi:phage gp45-like